MDRRTYLRLVSAGSAGAIAGCSGTIESIRPQNISDDRVVGANTIRANYEPIQDLVGSYFRSYSLQGGAITFSTNTLTTSKVQNTMRVGLLAQQYPNGELLDAATTAVIDVEPGTSDVALDYSFDSISPGQDDFFLSAYLYPDEAEFVAAIERGEVLYLCETDRLTLRGVQLAKDPHPAAKSTLETESYRRIAGEGTYAISVDGEVNFGITVYKHAYIASEQRSFRRTERVIRDAYHNGLAGALASIVYRAAERAGYTSERAKANYAVRAVQAFPYVSDSVTAGYDDYNKSPIETIVQAGGDCEDTVILLASTLISQPYGYGCALLFLPAGSPTHIALGVEGGKDVTGAYYTYEGTRYYYTETTGQGWDIGDLPREFRNTTARVEPIF